MPTRSRSRTAPVAWSTSGTANADSTAHLGRVGHLGAEDRLREHVEAEAEVGLVGEAVHRGRVAVDRELESVYGKPER